MGTHQCGKKAVNPSSPKGRLKMSCVCFDYVYIVVVSFYNQIYSEYYGENISVSTEGITLDHFSARNSLDSFLKQVIRHVIMCFTSFF